MNPRDPKKTGRVIVLGVIFLLLLGANLFCFFLYRKPSASAPNTQNLYVPRPQSRISLPPKQRLQVNEAPMPISPSVALVAAVEESAFYLGEWAALETDNSLEPDLFPTPSPNNSGGDVTGNTNPSGFGANSLVASGGDSAGSGGAGYTIPTGFVMANTYGSGFSSGLTSSTASGDDNSTIPEMPPPGLNNNDSGDDAGAGDTIGGLVAAGSGDPGDTESPDDPDNPMPPDGPYVSVLGGAPLPASQLDPQTTGDSATGPEPATGILLFCAIASTAALRRNKRRKT